MPKYRFFLYDFVEIQKKSFRTFLQKGFINEFSKHNPITNNKKNIEIFFYPEYYQLTQPDLNPREAIIKGKSYSSKIFIPVQLTDKKNKKVFFQWVFLGNLPIMTKRGHFILNGAARVIVNQILRSPGIYYHEKLYFNEEINQKGSKRGAQAETQNLFFKRYYADIICVKGTWLRIEIDKDQMIWAQMKKIPKIPIFWFLMALGLTEKILFNSIIVSGAHQRLLLNIENMGNNIENSKIKYKYVQTPPEAWREISFLLSGNLKKNLAQKKNQISKVEFASNSKEFISNESSPSKEMKKSIKPKKPLKKNLVSSLEVLDTKVQKTPSKFFEGSFIANGPILKDTSVSMLDYTSGGIQQNKGILALNDARPKNQEKNVYKKNALAISTGRKWIFNRFLNPKTYDLGNFGRYALNKKLGLSISNTQTTLTPQDILKATDFLLKVEKGLKKIDDIDSLKNKRVRTSGELLQIQTSISLVRLEKVIREKLNNLTFTKKPTNIEPNKSSILSTKVRNRNAIFSNVDMLETLPDYSNSFFAVASSTQKKKGGNTLVTHFKGSKVGPNIKELYGPVTSDPIYKLNNKKITSKMLLTNLVNSKIFNSALKEFFGTSPLSQFMDQINPLAEITHKRRLTSMGPGGVSRDSATLAIRGIHPTHYGRICPIETPEGKNTGLVNSMTTFAIVNEFGLIETPFYKVYKGQVQKKMGMYYFSSLQEEKITLAAPDLLISKVGFLPKTQNPVKKIDDFTKRNRKDIEFIGVSPVQMVSIATSLIPFLEHDDANRALMGSNMQRQAVPLIRPERPIVTTGLEARVVSDSGQAIQATQSGVIACASAEKIIVFSF